LFPQLIAGPILQYRDLDDQLRERAHTQEKFASGVQIFLAGLSKKVLLANNIGMLWDTCKAMPADERTVLAAWLGVIAYTFQIYFDFSGYSDMAIGLGRMLGFEFLPNFNYPYISRSITEFWRRWHISLGSWFREYVYIPMGGNRVSGGRLFFNLMVVWGLTGLWHGASWNFLLWGLYFGVLLILEKRWLHRLLDRLPSLLRRVYTLLLVLVSWAIFAVEDLGQLGAYLNAMLGVGVPLADPTAGYYAAAYLPVLLTACVAATPLGKSIWHRLPEKGRAVALPLLVTGGLLLCTAYLVDATYNPFLYFRF
jgi:alginate O-acetyltransferase complex protein AlgI